MILERLKKDVVLGDGGALFEMERRGYISAGPFTPEVCIEHPDAVLSLHTDFARAGAEVLQSLTYYGHEEKLKSVGMGGMMGEINASAVKLARKAAENYGCLVAGNVANTWVYDPQDTGSHKKTREQFDLQLFSQDPDQVDFFIAETIEYLQEALIALEAVIDVGKPAMITLGFKYQDRTADDVGLKEAFTRLEDAGAHIVGINCFRDPERMIPLLAALRPAVSCFVAAQPVAYRCLPDTPYFQARTFNGRPAFPLAMDPFVLTRFEMADFARRAGEMGVNYIGGCCGTGPHHIRAMAEALGRKPPSSRYSPRLDLHPIVGDEEHLREKDARIICEQRYGRAACHFLTPEKDGDS